MKKAPLFKFLLYVAGTGPNSTAALSNLQQFCQTHLPERHEIEVVDVFRHPERALSDGVLLTPMLVKLSPLPERKIIGSLSQDDVLLQALGLGTGT